MTDNKPMRMHTPGPWSVDYIDNIGFYVTAGDGIDGHGGHGWLLPKYAAEGEANARLMASAPDLLAALEALTATARTFRNVPADEQEWTPIDDEALDAAFAAIAKATGEDK
jgi:hypothetical protein